MRIAIIEFEYRQYLLDIFARHPEFEAEISCFAEWEPKTQADGGIPVIPISKLKNEHYDIVLIAIWNNHRLSRLLTYLHDEAVGNIYVIRLFALDTLTDFIAGTGFDMTCVDKIPEQNEKPYLVHLETHINDQCNLNCKGCNNFSPFVKERRVTDLVQFESDMQHLNSLFSNIGRFFLLGGEPLLEPEHSCKMIEIARRHFPNAELRLLTNAVLVPKMKPEFWECIRANHVIIHISAYPPVRPKLPEIEAVLQTQQTTFLVARKAMKFERRWTLYPFEDEKYNNDECGSAGCHMLRNGVLSKCPDAILIGEMAPALSCSPEELCFTKDRLALDSYNDGWEVIRQLNAPCMFCKKCTIQRIKLVQWEACGTAAEPNDWLVENRLEYENRQLQTELQHLNEQWEQKNRQLQTEIQNMQASRSFRLGRAVTWLPRKVRNGIRGLKERR